MHDTSALGHAKLKSQNLHDWGSVSPIDPINPLAYIIVISRNLYPYFMLDNSALTRKRFLIYQY